VSRASDIIAFIDRYLVVPEGAQVGKPMRLRPFQKQIIHGIYDSPDTRRAIVSMGRKNGKTALLAMLLLAHLVGPEARRNAQLYSTALARDQAALLFSLAAKMARMSCELHGLVRVIDSRKELFCPTTGVRYRALSQDAGVAHGLSPQFVVHDETGRIQGPRSPLYEAVETGMMAQPDPLSIIISTQAASDADLLSILIDDAQSESASSRTKLFLFTAPPEADPWSEETWRLANPALDDFQSLSEIKELAATAQRLPAQEASFRNLVLNQRVNAEIGYFISPELWAQNGEPPDLSVLESEPVWVGVDLSSTQDLTALVLAAQKDGVWHIKPLFFIPGFGLAERARRDRVPYDVWAREEFIVLVPGKAVEEDFVAQFVVPVLRELKVQSVAYDRYHMPALMRAFARIGYEPPFAEDFGQSYKTQSPAIKVVETLLLEGRIRHGGHPVLQMCALNARVQTDEMGNRRLVKGKSTGRIDGMIALVNAIGAAAAAPEPEPEPYYMTHGLLVLGA
jgi:phage terminase large subunit-like protein